MSTIVLNSLNYVGTGIIAGVSSFWERASGVVNGFSHLSARVNLSKERTNVLWRLTVPVIKGDDSACGCAGEVERTTEISLDVRFGRAATAAERADVLKRIQDLVLTSEFTGSVTGLNLPA